MPSLSPRRIALAYGILAASWILVSDAALAALPASLAPYDEMISAVKGWAFVAVTAAVLYVLVRSLVRDVEAGRERARAAADAADRLAASLRLALAAEGAVVRSRSEDELFERICAALVADGRFRCAWIGFAEPDGSIRLAAKAGDDGGYLDELRVRWDDTPLGRGPTGTATRDGRTFIVADVATDPRVAPWRERQLAAGFRSSIAVPIHDEAGVLGVLSLYAAVPGSVAPLVVAELERVATDTAYAVRAIRAQAERNRAVAAEVEASRRLAAASERYARLVAEAPLSIVVAGLDGIVRSWNPAAERMWGLTADEAIGRFAPWVLPPEREAFLASLADAAAGRPSAGAIRTRHRADGSEVVVRVATAAFREADGSVAILGIAEDVTAQLAAEQALARSLRRLEGLRALDLAILSSTETAEIARASLDHLAGLVDVERLSVTLFDLDGGTVTGFAAASGTEIGLPDRVEALPIAAAAPLPDRLASAEGPLLLDLSAVDGLGPFLAAALRAGIRHVLAFPLRSVSGRLLGSLSLGVADEATLDADATETAAEVAAQLAIALRQARYRDRLEEREVRLRTILEGSPNAVLTVGSDGRLTYANPAADAAFRAAGTLVGRQLADMVPAGSADDHGARLASLLADPATAGVPHRPGVEARRLDGTAFPAVLQVAPIAGPAGPEVVVTLVDLSERVALEQRLAQAERMETLGQFAGILAHDVRTYIRAIGWAADALASDLAPDDPRRRDVVQIQHAVTEAREMIASVLEFARGGRATGSTDLAAHVARIGGILDRLAGPDVDLEVDVPSDLPPVALAPASITQVLVNLATNARDAMPGGGALRIAARVVEPESAARNGGRGEDRDERPGPARRVRLTIADTGVGMDGATADRAFEPFYTTRAEDDEGGTGLGLPGVYLLVTRAGGAVRLESSPGAGTTVTIDLPVTVPA